MINTWVTFAEKIIRELAKYDEKNRTYYSYYLDEPSGPNVLAEIMARVDKQSRWEPVQEKGEN